MHRNSPSPAFLISFDPVAAPMFRVRRVCELACHVRRDGSSDVGWIHGTRRTMALWVKRSAKPEFFIFHPTVDGNWNPHSSLHKDGTFHLKSHDRKALTQKRQPPASIKGSEHLSAYGGFSPKSIGAACDPSDFDGVFEAPPGVLGPRNGMVTVDLIEPGFGAHPLQHPAEEVDRRLFTDGTPHLLIRIFRT